MTVDTTKVVDTIINTCGLMRVRIMFLSCNRISGRTIGWWLSDNAGTISDWTFITLPLSTTWSFSAYCFNIFLSSRYRLTSACMPEIRCGSTSEFIFLWSASILSSNDRIVFATISVSSRSNTIPKHLRFSITRHES